MQRLKIIYRKYLGKGARVRLANILSDNHLQLYMIKCFVTVALYSHKQKNTTIPATIPLLLLPPTPLMHCSFVTV